MSSYDYRPLEVSKNEIRLLILKPGTGDSVVEVEIIHESLDDHPCYEALSYVWGDPTVTEDIHIAISPQAKGSAVLAERQQISQKATITYDLHVRSDSKTHPVGDSIRASNSICVFKATTNLKSALWHLRLPDEPRLLWVDAICINQHDSTERRYQVRQMDRIYRMCSQVCIWLGKAGNDSDLAIDLMNSMDLACNLALLENPASEINFRDTFLPVAQRFLEDEQFILHFRALTSLICRPWFTRLWIVQEVVLAPTKTVFCGSKTASLGLLFRTFLSLYMISVSKNNLMVSLGQTSALTVQDLSHDVTTEWRDAVVKFMRLGTMTINQDESPLPLRGLFRELRGRGMTDKRDAVYAVLSLASDVSPRDWDVRYDITRTEAFKIAVKKQIEISQSLDIICDSPACPHENRITPSWLPCFDAEELPCGCNSFQGSLLATRGMRIVKDGERVSLYDASKDSRANVVISEDGNKLQTDGILVDHIKQVMERPFWTLKFATEPDLIIPRQWLSLALSSETSEKMDLIQMDANQQKLNPSRFEALWRTMICDRVGSAHESAPSVIGEGFGRWLEDNQGDLQVSANEAFDPDGKTGMPMFKKRLYTVVGDHKTLVVTEGGLLGLAKGSVAPGDQVYILFGCSVPTILRPVSGSLCQYLLIGESYIHGMMDGEATDGLEKGEYERKKLVIL